MAQQQARRRPAPLNTSSQVNMPSQENVSTQGNVSAQGNLSTQGSLGDNIPQYIAHANGAITDALIIWRSLGQRLESHQQLNARSSTAVSEYITDLTSKYENCYTAYCGEYKNHQETRATLNQTRILNQEIRNAVAREQEGHQYVRTELELLKDKLDEERRIKENLEGMNKELREGMNEHERINNELHSLMEAMEKDNRAMRATIDQLQKEPGKADEDGVDVIGWSEAQEVISVCSPTLQTQVTNLEAENEALKKQLQEAKDALMASQLSRGGKGNKRRKHNS